MDKQRVSSAARPDDETWWFSTGTQTNPTKIEQTASKQCPEAHQSSTHGGERAVWPHYDGFVTEITLGGSWHQHVLVLRVSLQGATLKDMQIAAPHIATVSLEAANGGAGGEQVKIKVPLRGKSISESILSSSMAVLRGK